MKVKKELPERKISTVLNYFYWFFMGNLYFALMNIPLLFLLLAVSPPRSAKVSMLEIFLCCLPAGPALTALSGCMAKLVREKDVTITRDFFRIYKKNFVQSLLLWAGELAIILILYVDVASTASIFSLLYLIMILYAAAAGIYMYPVLARFHMRSLDVVFYSISCVVRNLRITLSILLCVAAGAVVFYIIPGIAVLFIASFVCYCAAYYQRDMLKTLETRV